MGLKIEYGSSHELFELFKKHPEDMGEVYKQFAAAQREFDTATMELEIVTAEIIDEICKERYSSSAPATAKQEIRRAEVQLDHRWQKLKRKAIDANANCLVLKGRLNGMWGRGDALKMLGQAEMKIMYVDPVVHRDTRLPETKIDATEGKLDLPED